MNLCERTLNSNIYDMGKGIRRSIIGGIPNVVCDSHGTLKPFDNRLKVSTSHPVVGYLVKQGPFEIGFHKKSNNRYMSAIRLHTGETLIKTADNDVPCTPVVENNRTIKWLHPNGAWIKEVATEKQIKETMLQKAGQTVTFRYKLNGLTAKSNGNFFDIYREGKRAFSIQKPYYMDSENGEFESYVDIQLTRDGDDYLITYPAPEADKFIDPTVVFGAGAGQVGSNKQGAFRFDLDLISQASDEPYTMDGPDIQARMFLLRFDMSSLPTNSIINTAVLSVRLDQHTQAGNTAFEIRQMLMDWGITKTNGGVTENPATGGQATLRSPFDTNNVGTDPTWTLGDYTRGTDSSVIQDTVPILQTDPAGTFYDMNVKTAVESQVLNDSTNYGFILELEQTYRKMISTLLSITAAYRPYLTVDYTVPSPVISGLNQANKFYKVHNR